MTSVLCSRTVAPSLCSEIQSVEQRLITEGLFNWRQVSKHVLSLNSHFLYWLKWNQTPTRATITADVFLHLWSEEEIITKPVSVIKSSARVLKLKHWCWICLCCTSSTLKRCSVTERLELQTCEHVEEIINETFSWQISSRFQHWTFVYDRKIFRI